MTSLTPAEWRVLRMRAEGMGVGEIASETGRAFSTVRNQITAIYAKLGAASLIDAVRIVGWLDMSGGRVPEPTTVKDTPSRDTIHR